METPDSGRWSELPMDILRSVFKRLSFVDFHRAKIVSLNWYLCSKQTARPKIRSPLLMLSPEEGGCRLYIPQEDRVYETKSSDFSGYRFLGSSGKWFLVVDPGSNLYIIDVFSEDRIHLPPIESIQGGRFKIKRLGDNRFCALYGGETKISNGIQTTADDLRGLLWVDDDKSSGGDYVVVWQFDNNAYLGYCKKGDHHYREIQTQAWEVRRELRGMKDMVLKGCILYIFADREFIRRLDLSGEDGIIKDVSENHRHPMWKPMDEIERMRAINVLSRTGNIKDVSVNHMHPIWKPNQTEDEIERMRAINVISHTGNIAVSTSGEVLFVDCKSCESNSARHMMFRLYKRDAKDLDPNTYDTRLVEVDSLGDEALFLDLGITVPADRTLGIEPNSIYYTRGGRIESNSIYYTLGRNRQKKRSCLDICVYNLATKKTNKDFPGLSSLNLKDAYWFLPS